MSNDQLSAAETDRALEIYKRVYYQAWCAIHPLSVGSDGGHLVSHRAAVAAVFHAGRQTDEARRTSPKAS